MESQKPKIALYVKRSFGDKLNATMDFIKENLRTILKFCTYLLLPFSLLQALTMNGLMSTVFSVTALQTTDPGALATLGMGFWLNYGFTVLCAMIGNVIMCALVYALVKLYNDREERLMGLTFADLRPVLLRNIGRMLLLTLFGIVLFMVIGGVLVGLTVLTPFTLLITLPLLVAGLVPLALFTPIYLMEDIGLWSAFMKTFRLGFATWGGVFLVGFVMLLISSVLQGVTTTPWYVASIVKYFFMMSDTQSEVTVSVGYSFILYVLGVIQVFGAYLSMVFAIIGIVYQYGHASEVVDSVSVESDIDNFEQL